MPSTKSKPTLSKWHFEAFGTPWYIETANPLELEIKNRITDKLEQFDATYSRFRADSLVSQLRKPGRYAFPDDFGLLYDMYKTCYELTNGQMTPLIGSALEDAGYDSEYRFTPRSIEPVPAMADVLDLDDKGFLTVYRPVVFDVGAAGKGYAVDILAEILNEQSITHYVIDASGDIRHSGSVADIIGLEDPFDHTKVIGTVELRNQSLCASAINRRSWGELHHIINPLTLQPERRVVATWVIANDALTADALATALFFIDDPKELLSRFDVSYVRLFADGTLDDDPQFKGELFI